jgi:type I site-specific restriction endonuclease
LLSIDQYDLMLIDQCHRGYLLDREMSDAELGLPQPGRYVSKYRRVLEHFDAVKVGLTATPAMHTVQIFGDPVFTGCHRRIGSFDRVQTHIRSFRNDANPKIAVTVDLLTTGIDVPPYHHLSSLRRVNSRILYEQMLGRATRLCPDIGQETFRSFDAVDLYRNLRDVRAMKTRGRQSRYHDRLVLSQGQTPVHPESIQWGNAGLTYCAFVGKSVGASPSSFLTCDNKAHLVNFRRTLRPPHRRCALVPTCAKGFSVRLQWWSPPQE